jgi:hypothetical protein
VADHFAVSPDEFAYTRNALFAVEVLDPVALTVIRQGVRVTATGLKGDPIVNYGGRFVWLEQKSGNEDAWPKTVIVEPGNLPFERAEVPAPPRPVDVPKAKEEERLLRVTLMPKSNYAFRGGDGVLAVQGRLVEDAVADPQVPVPGASVWLRWQDADTGAWNNAPVEALTYSKGEFLTFIRLPPAASPVVDASGLMSVVIRVRRDVLRETTPFLVPQGQVSTTIQELDWSRLQRNVSA